MLTRHPLLVAVLLLFVLTGLHALSELTPMAVVDDPLVRMPGMQPDSNTRVEGPNRCLNCHGGYDAAVEPAFNWLGSMMGQAARDPIFWACLTVAAQDAMWATGNARNRPTPPS